MPRPQLRGPLRRAAHIGVIALVAVSSGLVPPPAAAGAAVRRVTSTVTGSDGQPYRITNHLTRTAQAAERPGAPARQWLLVWTGDAAPGPDGKPDPDFLAVVDATPGSPDYGRVANTVTVDSVFGNEPHHMQYTWRKGDKVYAGGLLSDTVYVFDVSRLPRVSLSGVTLPHDTPCGSVPDAFTVLRDGTAYGSYMGGPDVAGPCTYSDGQTRVGNGFAGSPGEVVRLGADGRVLAEMPAAKKTAEDPVSCPNQPALPVPTCANPHGIALREDLNRLVTSDFVEVRHVVAGLVTDPNLQRRTVRTYDISDRNRPRLLSLSYLPDGPRVDDEYSREGLLAMEPAVTHQPRHKGAFVATGMGAVYYTPDITKRELTWRQVFDDATAFRRIYPRDTPTSAADGGSWLMVSPDDRFLFHTVMFGGNNSPAVNAESGMVYVLDIRRLLAAGSRTSCRIDTIAETVRGGAEPDCPALVSALPIVDTTLGGPHWGAMDTFRPVAGGKHFRQTDQVSRVVTSNYFVAPTGLDGDARICMALVDPAGRLTEDRAFRDEHTGRRCVSFDRTSWPHGDTGKANPHGLLFAVADAQLR
ncbi:selenium-binding family protein [Micromonospora chalcea]|uniref:selenium-binding family protein n=1 Tax=Micromonospora chalcea TaxID=1874 RepID=UPI001CA70EBA|nr:selenium-binding family protein [Micromonospora chalcea]